jgi:type I restriction enzyme, S subunit
MMAAPHRDWQLTSIGNLLLGTIDYRGKTPPMSKTGIPCISAANIKGGVVTIGEKFVSNETYALWTTRGFIKPGDVLITTEAPVAEVAQLPADRTYLITRRVIALQVNPSEANEKFLKYWLLCRENKKGLELLAHGATVPRIFKEDILECQLVIPPLQTQRKIAAILSAYDDLIENNLRRIKILEEIAQNLYLEWFVKFRFPGHKNVRLVDSPLGRIPQGWESINIRSIADTTYGFAFKSKQFNSDKNGIPVVRIRDVLAGTSPIYSPEKAGAKYLVENGDILVGMDGEFHMGFWIGGPAYLVQRVARFRTKGNVGRHFLFLSLKGPIKHFNATITGTTVAHLGDKHIKTIEIVCPPQPLSNQANDILEPFLDQILTLRLKNATLRSTRDLFLPKLISGEIDLSKLDVNLPEETHTP